MSRLENNNQERFTYVTGYNNTVLMLLIDLSMRAQYEDNVLTSSFNFKYSKMEKAMNRHLISLGGMIHRILTMWDDRRVNI